MRHLQDRGDQTHTINNVRISTKPDKPITLRPWIRWSGPKVTQRDGQRTNILAAMRFQLQGSGCLGPGLFCVCHVHTQGTFQRAQRMFLFIRSSMNSGNTGYLSECFTGVIYKDLDKCTITLREGSPVCPTSQVQLFIESPHLRVPENEILVS